MAMIQRIDTLDDPRVAAYRDLQDLTVKERSGLFVGEGRLVVRLMLEGCRFRTRSVLLSETAWETMGDAVALAEKELPVYVAAQDVIDGVAGFALHRGCVALGERRTGVSAEQVLEGEARSARLIAVVHNLANHDNVGGVFRNAAGFGAGAVLLTPRTCDPLYRKAIRVSMGHALRMPFGAVDEGVRGVEFLRRRGWRTLALTPSADAEPIGALVSACRHEERVALFIGAEGAGLPREVLAACDHRVRIPMASGVDSLNTATASGIALQRFAEAMGAV